MSADLPDDQMRSQAMPDLRALDAALREVLRATPRVQQEPEAEPVQNRQPLELDQTMDVVSRAASAIDELIERNRSITNAAVRSVEFLRAQAGEYRGEIERLHEELRLAKEQVELQRVAALAHAQELEDELAIRTEELETAQRWITQISTQVAHLLGDAETRLSETADEPLFG